MSTSIMRFGDLPREAAGLWPGQAAVTFRGARFTFEELGEQIDRAARALVAHGVRKGDVVAIWMTNRTEFPIIFFAAMRIGAIVAPINTRYRALDIAHAVRLTECKCLFVVDRSGPVEYVEMLKTVLPGFDGRRYDTTTDLPLLQHIVVVSDEPNGAPLSWQRFIAQADQTSLEELASAAALVTTRDIALIVLTSGTTGDPKGVMHDHGILRNIRERHEDWPIRAGESVLCFLPWFHIYGMCENMIAGMLMGFHQIVMDVWNAEEALSLIESERVAGLHGFETHYSELLRAQGLSHKDLSSVRFGSLPAGMETSNAVAVDVQKTLCPTVSGWGMSEMGSYVFMSRFGDTAEQRCTTSGRPMPGLDVRIVDPITGADQPDGIEGEILASGYTIMRGYFRDPEATARAIDSDGWLHSGDRGFLRSDGFLRFLGRYKEMLKVGGENVSPAALEQELAALVPSIAQVAVVGVADRRLQEVPCAYVVPKPGMTCSLEEVLALCSGKIASFKIPRYVIAVETLPMTASGKVQRVALRERADRELIVNPPGDV